MTSGRAASTRPPLERASEWIETTDPTTGKAARRDAQHDAPMGGELLVLPALTATPTTTTPWISEEAERYWMPVDLYVGGAEHAVLHLLYSRFWHKFLYDLGVVHTKEPFQKLVNQGMILGSSFRYYDDNRSDDPAITRRAPTAATRCASRTTASTRSKTGASSRRAGSGPRTSRVPLAPERQPVHPTIPDLPLEEVVEKMSKSRGNVINPDDVITEFGADSMRLYEMFIGPLDKDAPWSTDGIQGVYRFLQRAWRLFYDDAREGETRRDLCDAPETKRAGAAPRPPRSDGVTEDLEAMQFNTAISKLMVFVRDIAKDAPLTRGCAERFVLLLAPFAPHLGEELWRACGHDDTLTYEAWPVADAAHLVADTLRLAVQVNGKRRDEIEVAADADKDAIEATALASEAVQRHLDGKAPKKVIVVPGRLVNVVA